MNRFSIILSIADGLSSAVEVYRSVINQRLPEDQLIILASNLEFINSTSGLSPNDIIVDPKQRRLSQSKNIARQLADGNCAIFLDENQVLCDCYLSHIRMIDFKSSVYTDFRKNSFDGKQAAIDLQDFDINEIYAENLLPSGCFLYTCQDYRQYAFDEDLEILEDWDFQLNVLTNSGFEHLAADGSVSVRAPDNFVLRKTGELA